MFDPFQFVVVADAGWMNQRKQQAIEYLREENRVLREQLGNRRVRLNDDQRHRLADPNQLVGQTFLNMSATAPALRKVIDDYLEGLGSKSLSAMKSIS